MAFLRDRSVYCIPKEEIDKNSRIVFSTICLVTSTVSAFGACTQLRAWYEEITNECSRRPTPLLNHRILFSLALADLLACIGVIGMSIIFILFDVPIQSGNDSGDVNPSKYWYVYVGAPIETFTMFSYVATYMWTFSYALDSFLQFNGCSYPRFQMKFYHIISWILPAWIVGCCQFAFIYDAFPGCTAGGYKGFLQFLVCYVPLLFTMVTVPVLYFMTHRRVRHNMRGTHGMYTDTERQIENTIRRKFFLICVVFVACWILNFAEGIYDLHIESQQIKDRGQHFSALWIIEACINPLQGFLNCLVYGKQNQFRCCTSGGTTSYHNQCDMESPTQSEPSSSFFREREGRWVDSASSSRTGRDQRSPLLPNSTFNSYSSAAPYSPFVAQLLGESKT